MASVAVIDIGSNSIKVLIATRDAAGQVAELKSRTIDARISAGIIKAEPKRVRAGHPKHEWVGLHISSAAIVNDESATCSDPIPDIRQTGLEGGGQRGIIGGFVQEQDAQVRQALRSDVRNFKRNIAGRGDGSERAVGDWVKVREVADGGRSAHGQQQLDVASEPQ